MDIYIAHQTAGGGGGGPRGNLSYFDKVITEVLSSPSFESSFDEFWLTLNYLPADLSPGAEGDYKNYFNTLPISRLNRRYKKIEVNLQAPEFAGHFGKNGHANYFENQYRDLAETDLAKLIINKFIEAGAVVSAKLKDGDRFNFEVFKGILLSLEQKIDPKFLITENERQANKISSDALERAIRLRDERKKSNKPKDKIIRDFRVYPLRNLERLLQPFEMQYAEIFRNLLLKSRLKCPGYNHIFIQIGQSFEEALRSSNSLENWAASGLSVIDLDDYLNRSDPEKEKIVFDAIVTGLKDIAEIDGLDRSIIDATIEEIKKNGLNTELQFKALENRHHKLTITYFSRSTEEECPVYLSVTEKASGKTGKLLVGSINSFQLYYWMRKITLTRTQVKIQSGSSTTASLYGADKPRSLIFSITEILDKPSFLNN